jgi:hypothetical protein
MTAGQANTIPNPEGTFDSCNSAPDNVYDSSCGDQVSVIASQQSIDSSCNLNQNLNATVYSIGFGPLSSCDISNQTLGDIADCGQGEFFVSADPSELRKIYENIAKDIVSQSYIRQIITVDKTELNTILYPDSFIEFEFEKELEPLEFRQISLTFQTDNFPDCDGSFYIPEEFILEDIKVTSYSFDYWSDSVRISNSNTGGWYEIFSLSDFGDDYETLGDPFIIEFIPDLVAKGEDNQISVTLASGPNEPASVCSQNNKIIYTTRISAYTEFSPVLPESEGKNVLVYFDKNHDGTADGSVEVSVGENIPDPTPIEVGDLDISNNAVHFAFYRLLEILNFENPTSSDEPSGSEYNPIDIEITEEIRTDTIAISNIPSLWGPLNFRVIL